jgi:hypothetical protein
MVLVHSPLVGPFTWSLVAQHLQAGGFDVLVPPLTDSGGTPPPYWQQHTASVQRALASLPQERALVLVGHSGAGSLLPVLAQAARHPVKAYLFVDAGLPHPRKSCQTLPDGPMLLVAISCLPRAIAPIWSKHTEPGGRAERYRQGIFTCWLIPPPWLRPLSNSCSR